MKMSWGNCRVGAAAGLMMALCAAGCKEPEDYAKQDLVGDWSGLSELGDGRIVEFAFTVDSVKQLSGEMVGDPVGHVEGKEVETAFKVSGRITSGCADGSDTTFTGMYTYHVEGNVDDNLLLLVLNDCEGLPGVLSGEVNGNDARGTSSFVGALACHNYYRGKPFDEMIPVSCSSNRWMATKR